MELITPLASSMFAPTLSFMDSDLHNTSGVLSSMVVTIFVFGFVLGRCFLRPWGDIWSPTSLVGLNLLFVTFQIDCALAPNIGSLIAFHFLAGIGGSGCLAVGGGIISDLFIPQQRGLAMIGFGFLCGLVTVAKISDATVVRMTFVNGGVIEAEMRLPACVFFACLIPVSFFWYGWSADTGTYWLVSIIGLVPFGFGMVGVFIPTQTYLIDTFSTYAASAIAALTATRSLFGRFLALAGPSMNAKLGTGWANSVLGFVTFAFVPATALIARYGGILRKRYPINIS